MEEKKEAEGAVVFNITDKRSCAGENQNFDPEATIEDELASKPVFTENEVRNDSTPLEEFLKQTPPGVKLVPMKLTASTILLQVVVHQEEDCIISQQDLISFTQDLKKVLPSNVLMICSPEQIKFQVHRPLEVILNFQDSTFENKDLLASIKKTLEMGGNQKVKMTFKKCRFLDKK
jgi:hypothetical protein